MAPARPEGCSPRGGPSRAAPPFGVVCKGSLNTTRPWRTSPASDQSSVAASVLLVQFSMRADKGRNELPGDGTRHKRFKSRATITSCSGSGSLRSGVPGWQRSRSSAPKSSSVAKTRAVGLPFQNCRPSLSCLASVCGIPSFETAARPLAEASRCCPCATRAIERIIERKRPSLSQYLQHFGEPRQPYIAHWDVAAVSASRPGIVNGMNILFSLPAQDSW
jgi:hypothetical protein